MVFTRIAWGLRGANGMTLRQFRDLVVHRLRQANRGFTIEPLESDSFTVSWNGHSVQAHLRNGFHGYQRSGDAELSAQRVVSDFADVFGADEGLCPDRLVPVIRHQERSGDGLLWAPVAGDLVALIMLDQASSVKAVMRSDIEALGISEDHAWEHAYTNITTRVLPLWCEEIARAGVHVVGAESGLATSILVRPELWPLQAEERIVYVGVADEILWAKASEPDGVDNLRRCALSDMRKGGMSEYLLRVSPYGASVFEKLDAR